MPLRAHASAAQSNNCSSARRAPTNRRPRTQCAADTHPSPVDRVTSVRHCSRGVSRTGPRPAAVNLVATGTRMDRAVARMNDVKNNDFEGGD